jgi:hypothetical protein
MLYTPAYIFTILLGIWVLSLIGCIVLGVVCYRLLGERRRLRARLAEVAIVQPVTSPSALEANARSPESTDLYVPLDAAPDGEDAPPAGR